MKQYKVKVKHDNGTANLLVIAESETHAKWRVMNTEGCPESAIISVKKKTKPVKKTPTKLSDFEFIFNGYGHYLVVYTSPKTYKKWEAVINYMPLIDDTKNSDNPTQKSLNELKRMVKANY